LPKREPRTGQDDIGRVPRRQRTHENRPSLELEPLAAQRPQDDLDPGIQPLGPLLGLVLNMANSLGT